MLNRKYYSKPTHVRAHTRLDPRIGKRVSVDSYNRNQRYRNYDVISRAEALRYFDQKSNRSKAIDLSQTSKKVFEIPNEYWVENMGRSDVQGIDTKTLKSDIKALNEQELMAIKDRFKGKFKKEIEDSAFGKVIMSEDHISGIIDNESFRTTQWYEHYKNGETLDINNQKIIIQSDNDTIKYLKIGDFAYRFEDIEDSLKNLKNPEIIYKENSPLLIKGENYSVIIAPKIGSYEEWENYKELSYKNYKQTTLKRKKIRGTKEKLAFGYGYDPNKLKSGIKNYEYSHTLEDGTKLYEFEPKLPYRLFKIFAEEMEYQSKGNLLKKGDIEITNDNFITKGNPEEVIKDLNYAISKIYQKYEPLPKYDINTQKDKTKKPQKKFAQIKEPQKTENGKAKYLNEAINKAKEPHLKEINKSTIEWTKKDLKTLKKIEMKMMETQLSPEEKEHKNMMNSLVKMKLYKWQKNKTQCVPVENINELITEDKKREILKEMNRVNTNLAQYYKKKENKVTKKDIVKKKKLER